MFFIAWNFYDAYCLCLLWFCFSFNKASLLFTLHALLLHNCLASALFGGGCVCLAAPEGPVIYLDAMPLAALEPLAAGVADTMQSGCPES